LDASPCTRADPCSITHAVAVTNPTRHTVKLAPGAYTASITIGKGVVIDGFGATVSTTANGPSAFEVLSNGALTLRGLAITALNTTSAAVLCDLAPSSLILDRVSLDAMKSTLALNPCTAKVFGSTFHTHSSSFAVLAESPSQLTIERSKIDGGGGIVA